VMSFMNGLFNKSINMSLIARNIGLIQSKGVLMLGIFKHMLLYWSRWVWMKLLLSWKHFSVAYHKNLHLSDEENML
jgi:hypothetical protein